MYNGALLDLDGKSGSKSILGNGNQVNICRSNSLTLNVTGNGNHIHVKDSEISLTVTGNGNNIITNHCDGGIYLIGNGNKCSMSGGGSIGVKSSTGNGNTITGGASNQINPPRPQHNVRFQGGNDQVFFNGVRMPLPSMESYFGYPSQGVNVFVGPQRTDLRRPISVES